MKFPCLIKFYNMNYSLHILVHDNEQFKEERDALGCWNHEVVDWKSLTPAAFPGPCEWLMILMRSELCQK